MKITITINCDNAAFDDTPEIEVSRILYVLSAFCFTNKVDSINGQGLYDINGNTVGGVVVKD